MSEETPAPVESTSAGLSDLGASIVRTLVPLVAGFILSLLAQAGLDVSEEMSVQLSMFLTTAFTGLWYVIFRYLETHVSEKWGWLLGLARPPKY